MKDMQDEAWIEKMKDLLEDYTPEDTPGDWKQVRRKLNRTLPWATRLTLFFRKPWIYALIFGAIILSSYFLFFYSDTSYVIPAESPITTTEVPLKAPVINAVNEEIFAFSDQRENPSELSIPKEFPVIIPDTSHFAVTETKTSSSKEDASFQIDHQQEEKFVYDPVSEPGAASPAQVDQPVTKARHRFDLSAITFPGKPWKVGVGYDYLAVIQPDTGKGIFRGLTFHFARKIAPNLWLGAGINIGKTRLERISKFWVTDWSKTDSAGTEYLRDSSVSYQRTQNHFSLPMRVTYDLVRTRNFALPLSAGATLGWVYSLNHYYLNDGVGVGASGGGTDGFTGFITADLGLGYEVFYLNGLSAILSAEYRRSIAGPKWYGTGQNFIGGRILINLDFDAGKWR